MLARNYLRIRLPSLLAVTILGTSCREHTMLRMHQDSAGVESQKPAHGELPTAPSTRVPLLTGSADQKSVTGSVRAGSVPLIHDTAMAEHIQYIHACAQTVTPQDLPKVLYKLERIANNLQKVHDKIDPKEKEYFQSMRKKLEARQRDLIHARKIIGQDAPRAWWRIFTAPSNASVEDTLASLEKSTKLMERYPKLAPKVASSVLGVLQKMDKKKICTPESTLKHVISFLREALQSAPQHTTGTLRLMKKIVKTLQDSGEAFDNECVYKRLIDTLARVAKRNAAHVKEVLKVLDPICDHLNVHVALNAINTYTKILEDHPQHDIPLYTAHLKIRLLQIKESVEDHESERMAPTQQEDVKNQKDEKAVGTATQSAPRVGPVRAPQAALRRPTVQLHIPVGSNEYIPASGGAALPAIAEAP